jgi:hypothetical protein
MVAIGDYAFPEHSTAVDVQSRFIDGTLKKIIRIDAIVLGSGNAADFLANVEDLEGEVEKFDRGEANLSITPGRYHQGIRLGLQRTLDRESKFAAFEILLLTDDRFERSSELHEEDKTIAASGDTLALSQAGNVYAFPEIALTATGDLVYPVLSDGTRSLAYNGTIPAGSVLVIDADAKTAILNGDTNALPKITGSFPLLSPGDTTLTYTDNEESSHQGSLVVQFRDTWV